MSKDFAVSQIGRQVLSDHFMTLTRTYAQDVLRSHDPIKAIGEMIIQLATGEDQVRILETLIGDTAAVDLLNLVGDLKV